MRWWLYALAAAIAASATAILSKVGVRDTPSNLATAIRTAVVLVIAWGVVFWSGDHTSLRGIKASSAVFLLLSGVATGVSWLAYFRALQLAPASRVAPVDKMSLGLTILFSCLFLGESISWKVAVGTVLIIAGALLCISK